MGLYDVQRLTAEEARDLARAGTPEARERMVLSMTGLAYAIANAYAGKSPSLSEADLRSEAFEALIRFGVDRWNPDGGAPFGAWCAITVRRRLARYVAKELSYQEHHKLTGTRSGYLDTIPSGEELAELRNLLQAAVRAGDISADQVAALVMEAQGFLRREIGDELGKSRRSVGRMLDQAKEHLGTC